MRKILFLSSTEVSPKYLRLIKSIQQLTDKKDDNSVYQELLSLIGTFSNISIKINNNHFLLSKDNKKWISVEKVKKIKTKQLF